MIRSKSRVGVVVGVGMAVVLAACGSSATPKSDSQASTTSKPSGSASTSKDLCTVITADDAATVFGESAQIKTSPSAEPLVSGLCLYHHEGDDFTVRNLLQIRIYPGEQFYGEKLFPKKKSLSGIGDKAFEDVNATTHKVEIQFVKDGKTGTINYTTGASADIESRVPALVAVAKKLAASM
jgi:hypothetical protein